MDDKQVVHLPAFLADKFGISRSEARRCIMQGGVKINGGSTKAIDVLAQGQRVTLGTRRTAILPDDGDQVRDKAMRGPKEPATKQ